MNTYDKYDANDSYALAKAIQGCSTMGSNYRVYANGTVVHEDDFEEYDNSLPYYDDYGEYFIPDELLAHLLENGDYHV